MNDSTVNIYAILLMISGIVTLAVACLPLKQGTAARVIGGLIGLGFLGYGIYLKFIFESGTVWIFYYVFILPFVYIARVVKAYADRRRQQDAQRMQAAYPQQAYGQPGYGQPGGQLPPPAPQTAPNSYRPPPVTPPQSGVTPPPPPSA